MKYKMKFLIELIAPLLYAIKKIFKILFWPITAPVKFICGWYRIATHITVNKDGVNHYIKSLTKTIKSLIAMSAITLSWAIDIAALLKLLAVIMAAFAGGKWVVLDDRLTLVLLAWFAGLHVPIGVLLGFAMKNYSQHHKVNTIAQFTKADKKILTNEKTGHM